MSVSPKKAAAHYNVSTETLRVWAIEGKVKYEETKGGHRRYFIEEKKENPEVKKKFIYARVSSKKQEGDLENQIKELRKHYPTYELIKDFGSGINYERRGLKKILDTLFTGQLEHLVITYKDRLTRNDYGFFEWIFQKHGAKLTFIHNAKSKTAEEELSEDVIAIITSFSAKNYGKHKYDNKKNKDIPTKEDG